MRNRKLFTDELAQLCKGRQEKYRPSNGTEGMMFMERWCDFCAAGPDCEIITKSMCYDADEDAYPPEWCYDADGQPCCKAFKEKGNGK